MPAGRGDVINDDDGAVRWLVPGERRQAAELRRMAAAGNRPVDEELHKGQFQPGGDQARQRMPQLSGLRLWPPAMHVTNTSRGRVPAAFPPWPRHREPPSRSSGEIAVPSLP
ncbi:hypothetical protein STHU_03090 [Allostella humosa]|nr:hypothetical protein STHU_03090 [Stella humosa]